jgi:uncharacterized membrane protein
MTDETLPPAVGASETSPARPPVAADPPRIAGPALVAPGRSPARAVFEERFHRNERVAFFSDAVFAIVVTLLVLGLRVPHLANDADPRELLSAIGGMRPELFSFVLSFLFVINLWVSHNLFFRILDRVNNTILWVNNLFLLFVCFIPFPTAVIGAYPDNPAAIVLFGLDWMAIAVILYVMGRYAIGGGLLSEHVDTRRYRQVIRVLGMLLPSSVVPLLVAFVQPMLALAIYVSMAVVGCVLSFRVKLAD